MILLKANSELKVVFAKLIKTIGRDIKWTEVFIINNNNLILAGKDSVLLFDFGNKMISFNPVEVHLKEDSIEQITKNELLENILNMTLYVFGKWEKIKGLTVEKDYPKLNELFGKFLNEINVEPVLTADNLRFYQNGVQITYEDIIQDILNKLKLQVEEESAGSEKGTGVENKSEKNKFNLGLWHNMVWTSGHYSFERVELSESDKVKSRIGNNFYRIAYQCPVCDEKLFLVIYPVGKELLIETDEKGVYLSRAYTCSACHSLYTPKPQMLLREGDAFCIDFEDDTEAYEDYLELIGKQGERTSNCNFNEYEVDYNKENRESEEQLEEICSDMDSMSEKEILELQDKMDSGFYPKKSSEKYIKVVDKELENRRLQSKEIENTSDIFKSKEKIQDTVASLKSVINHDVNDVKHEMNREVKHVSNQEVKHEVKGTSEDSELKFKIKQENSKKQENGIKQENSINKENGRTSRDSIKSEYGRKQESNNRSENNTIRSENMKLHNQLDQSFDGEDKNGSIDSSVYSDKEKELLQKVVSCKEKNYVNIIRVMEEIKKEDCSDRIKETMLHSLMELLKRRGKKELDDVISKVPENVSKTQYMQLKELIKQYKEIDNATHMIHLDFKRDEAEKQEITAYLKRANAKDRNSLMKLYHKLKKEDFEERNKIPFLENIYDKIYASDEATIKRICPDLAELTFEDGLQAYEEITTKDLLPELKSNILGMIDKRLTKIKMNECEQLVNKLSRDLSEIIPEYSRIHFYDVRKGMRSDSEDEETKIINKALNTYASGRGRYEFPILICDASIKGNGGKGFVLTVDHIFYNSLVNTDVIDVMKIVNIITRKGLFGTGIYADTKNSGKVKISNSLKLDKLKPFTNVLQDFISYLKEKPESRDVSYMVKEKHDVKCCYRCGYEYKGGNVCPKCYAKFNE